MSYRIEIIDLCDQLHDQLPQEGTAEIIKKFQVYNTATQSNQIKEIAHILTNPIIQQSFIKQQTKFCDWDKYLKAIGKFDWAIEISLLAGVTDNIATTAVQIIEDHLKINAKVHSSALYFLRSNKKLEEIEKLASALYNPVIQTVTIKNHTNFIQNFGMDHPRILDYSNQETLRINLNLPEEKLKDIGKGGIKNKDGSSRGSLDLSLESMRAIQQYFSKLGRRPYDIELESIAQTWSEHCKHTIFSSEIDEIKDGIYRHYIQRATNEIRKRGKDICISVFSDNSGAIIFDRRWAITYKVETHNTPSALDPFGGAITGILGVNRDCIGFGKGAKPVANTYGFCLAEPSDQTQLWRKKNKQDKMLSAKQIMQGVIRGINVGGNCSGIPTPQGFIYFDQSFRGKPLVFVGTIGIIPHKIKGEPAHIKSPKPGDLIVVVGGQVGRDGIHGANFSSTKLSAQSSATLVQIGDPITQKKLSDAIIKEARDLGLYNSITDNGAGGLSSSVGEMGKDGFYVELEKVPLKYSGMSPWEIWISESQERMTLAIPPSKLKKFEKIMQKHDVESTVIGHFTNSKHACVSYKGKIIMNIESEFLHNGNPPLRLKTEQPKPKIINESNSKIPDIEKIEETILRMLSCPNICSKEYICTQYDHEVQGSSVLKPIQGKGRVCANTTAIRPILASNRGIIISQGVLPRYSNPTGESEPDTDTYHMAACAIDTAIRNAVAAGANLKHMALLDNFCWCSSKNPKRLWQLKRTVQACYEYATYFGTPFISGKDSMFNDFAGYDEKNEPVKISALPTLLISVISVIKNIEKIVSIDAKIPGDLIYILGITKEWVVANITH
jgi:phosphoribosylformylglycinamidine synthase